MKYFRCIYLCIIAAVLTGATFLGLPGLNDAAADTHPEPQYFRVYFDSMDIAHKIVISMNAVETLYEAGYITVEVTSPEEYDRLLETGRRLEAVDDPMAEKRAAIQAAAGTQAQGIPSFPCYRKVEETFTTAEALAATRPGLVQWLDCGDSWQKKNGMVGYDMMVLVLTNRAIPGPKPRIFMTAAIHAREYTTSELVTRFAETLVDNYGIDADSTWILDHHEIHLMLHANPDGRKKAETGLYWRKNANRLYCEQEPGSRGADLNRNFEFKWNCCGGSSDFECSETFHGAKAASEPETQAVQEYLDAHFPDLRGPGDNDPAPLDVSGMYLDIHSSGRLILWPWGWTSDSSPNHDQFRTLARKLAYFNGHFPTQGIGLYATDGTTDSYGYGKLGVPSLAYELGTDFFEDCTYFEQSLLPGNLRSLQYAVKASRAPFLLPAGPDTVALKLDAGSSPQGIAPGTQVRLTAVIDDTRFSNSNGDEPSQFIGAAEYTVDDPPWLSGPATVTGSMSPTGAGFDGKQENVEAVIDTTGWKDGRHLIFVRGRDEEGHWGVCSAVFLYIAAGSDRTPPSPDPMAWAIAPHADGFGALSMTAAICYDANGVEYYFQCLTPGGHDSGWRDGNSYKDTGLETGIVYSYRVRTRDKSSNRNTSAWSPVQSAATALFAPAAPANLRVRRLPGEEAALLTWEDNADNEAGYRIFMGSAIDNLTHTVTVAANTSSYTARELPPGHVYHFKVCAFNATGEACSSVRQVKIIRK